MLIVGSGNIVHDLPAVQFRLGEVGFDWAIRFNEAVRDILTDDPSRIGAVNDSPDYRLAVPDPRPLPPDGLRRRPGRSRR